MKKWLICALALCMLLATRASAKNETYVWAYGSSIQTPAHLVQMSVQTNADAKLTGTASLYRVPIEAVVARLRAGKGDPNAGDESHFALLSQTTFGIEKGYSSVVVSLDPKGPGYVLFVVHAGSASTSQLVDVSNIAFTTVTVGPRWLLVPTDLRTFNHDPSARVRVIDDAGSRELKAFSSGVFAAPAPSGKRAVFVGTASDGSIAAQTLEPQWWMPARSRTEQIGYVQTDRPIYRPGQTIDARAIVRNGSIGSYTVPAKSEHVRVTAPDGSAVFDRQVPLTSFGSAHVAVPLAADAQLGSYTIAFGDTSRSVTVAAYKKPEYELALSADRTTYVGSDRIHYDLDAHYFFGRPAAGMHLHYIAYKNANPRWWYGPYEFLMSRPWYGQREKVGEGDFVTGADGRHRVAVDTKRTDVEQTYTLRVEGRDASGRTVMTEQSVGVTPAAFSIALAPHEWFAQAGQPLSLALHTQTYDEHAYPNAHVHVAIKGSRYDPKTEKEVDLGTATVDVTTNARGEGAFSWTPRTGGSYHFTATSADDRGFSVKSDLYLWALGSNEESWFSPTEKPVLIAEKTAFAQGEPARVLVTLPKPDRDVIVTTASDQLVDARVVHVKGTTAALSFPVPHGVSHLAITAMLPSETGVSTVRVQVAVAPPPKSLRIAFTPHKQRYAPGERAIFDVHATDALGRPVRSEIALGVVDEAIYAVQADDAADPFDTFYDRVTYAYASASWYRPNRTLKTIARSSDVYSVAPSAQMGMAAPLDHAYSALASGPAMQSIHIRSNFQDAAYWSPSVITDANGRATVAFTWPENLTTWRATGVGVTRATDIGRGTGKALVTKDFLVRLETPRFLRAGDRSSVVGIAHGRQAASQIHLQLEAGALTASPFDALLHLSANDDVSTTWPISAPGVGGVMLTLRGTDGTLSDGTQTYLPLLGATAMEHERDAGRLPERSTLALQLPAGNMPGDLHLTLAPSVLAQLVQSVRLFEVYPYYCTEQTTSTALPAAQLLQIAKRYDVPLPADVQPRAIIASALDRLTELRHDDGAWGWWETDPSQPFMTAYAVYGLAEIRDALGSLPVPSLLETGAYALRNQLSSTSGEQLRSWGGGEPGDEWNVRAFMLMALADAGRQYVEPDQIVRSYDHLRELDPYGLAVLGLAAHRLGDDAHAHAVLAELDRRATVDGSYVFWHRDRWSWSWTSDPIETTAYALRLYVRVNPNSPRIPQIVNFLRDQRRGDWWYTTKDSAIASIAIAEAQHPMPDEMHPDETIRVKAGDRVVRELHITQPVLDAADAHIVVPASALQRGEHLAFERTGRGALYWSSDWERYVSPDAHETSDANRAVLDRLFAKPPALSVSRTYHVNHPGPWKIGDEVQVELTVSARQFTRYVAIEDPFPAGAEHQPLQGNAQQDAWSGFQFLDDRASFFADAVGPYPMHLAYTLRVTSAGSYAAPPPDAFAMYGPPVSALGSRERIEVQP